MSIHRTHSSGLTVEITVRHRHVDLAFHVPSGQVLALVGPNGAGKTTTLMTLAGWLMPDVGKAQLNGAVLFDCPDPAQKPNVWLPAQQRGIGYLSQHPHLFPHLNVLENIMYGMDRAQIPPGKARKVKAKEWLARVGLSGYDKRKPHQLSGGQAQRVAIARVLASGPQLVLLDEPLAALDIEAAPAIRQLLSEVLKDLTGVLVTHHRADVEALANDVYHITSPA